jgi:ribose transport system substrate-binding protein
MHRFNKALRGRRSVAAALGLIVPALALTACGSSNNSSTSSSAGAGTTKQAAATTSGGKPSWCGDKPITLGIYDGGGLNAWSADSLAQVKKEAAKCPAIKKQIVVNAGFNPQKGTSGMQSMIAQGANAMVVIPDSGVCAELPTMRQATQRGIKVAIYAADGCGKVGQDYVSYSDWDTVHDGKILTDFVAKQMNGKGNILFLGGPAGNIVDQGTIKGMYQSLKAFPNVKVLGNVTEKSWPVTNWDPAQAQKVTAGLLAKYPKVDAIVDEYGASVLGELKAFKDANRKVPAIATSHLNALACDWEKVKGTPNAFGLATLSNRNWTGALAVRKAVAAVNGITNADKQIIPLTLLTDSSSTTNPPKCYASKSPDYDPSNDWSEAELNKVIAGS